MVTGQDRMGLLLDMGRHLRDYYERAEAEVNRWRSLSTTERILRSLLQRLLPALRHPSMWMSYR